MNIQKITFRAHDFFLEIDYDHNARFHRVRTQERPRDGLMLAAARVASLALKVYEIPAELRFGVKSITFSEGQEPGTVVVLEGMHAKLSLEKIEKTEVQKFVKEGSEGHREYDPDHPQNIFNDEVKSLLEEIEFFIKGQRQQLSFEFEKERDSNLMDEGISLGVLTDEAKLEHLARLDAIQKRMADSTDRMPA